MRRNGPDPLQLALDRIARADYGVLWNEVLNDLDVTPAQRQSPVDRSIHTRRKQWEEDLRRRNRLTAKGFRVLHVTHERMRDDPQGVADEIAVALTRPLG